MNTYTIGYEGASFDEFVAELSGARIDYLIDVREHPISRKPGFSKTALAAGLAAAGLGYLHVKPLGCPKPIRVRYKEDRDWERYCRDFRVYLAEQSAVIDSLAFDFQGKSCALMCFERSHLDCHRTMVAEAIADVTSVSPVHLRTAESARKGRAASRSLPVTAGTQGLRQASC